jgi:hypothetical protein
MRTFMKWALILFVPAVFGSTARPADPAVAEGPVIKLLLLRQKSVQKELELAPETVKKIMDFTTAQSQAAQKALSLGEGERKDAFEKLRKEDEKFLTDTLNEKQSKRLHQITMQCAALTYLTKPEAAKALKLTDDQVKKLKDMQAEARKALVEVFEAKDRAAKTKMLAKLREETREKILAVLTDDQKTKVREMVGPKFEGELVFEEPEESKDK